MAERPLYTLYKNLKAQNYDVPDDYNKFESALTRDGKGGADNRHAIYENLKAQNFDVPGTYERFYSALFEPRSKTSSRAKGGSVPMSAADRARFSAGAQAISASAQQTMDNAGRYNRLKQRKQKQQKDFGRVNLGTHQTPYGGDANNVVKDDFAYNPETGKAGAYVSSNNENAYTFPDAEQIQAILDKQNDAYQVAVDTGEIPSVFDVRDKNGNYDLQENIGKNGTYLTEEGAQKQFDKKLADAYARKKEIEALIAEDNRQHGNPLLSYGASIGASNGRTSEQSDYRNKLATSLSLVTEQIGALEAVKQYPTSSWGEDALKALDNTAFTAKTWDFGLTDFATMGQMERIKTKMDNNIPLSGSDKMLLKSKLGADAAAALEDEKMGNIYRWTKIAGQSLPFMLDFFMTGGYGGITKGISRGALKFAAKRGMGKVSAAILKNTGIVAGDVIGSYAMAGTEQGLKTGADIMQRHLGSLYQDEKGDYKFGTFDENGNLLHEGGESMGTALYKGLTSAMVENYTEKLFGHNYGIKKGAIAAMEKHGMNGTAQFFKNIGKSGWYTNSKKWMEKFGINGFGEEVMEEEIGIPLHALLDGDNKFSDLGDAKQQLDIIGGMAISVGSMYAMGAGSRPVKGVYNRAQYYRFRNKVNVADSDAQNLLGDNWADIKDKIDNATNEQMGGVLAGILRQRDTMSKEQINAAVNYGVNLMKMRGYNIAKTAEMNAREITNEPTTSEEQHQTDIDNAYSEGHDADDADKHDIQIQQEDQMKTLAAALGISEQQLSAMSDEELESMTGQDDKLDQAIYDYQFSSARYQGVVDDAQDKVDLAAHQAEQRVDMYTDQSRGSVRNATIKASGGLEDYGVYIISGNVATHDDGSIDVSNSDDMILYYDPTTNSVEHADALMFAELGEELPADDVKAQAVADAKENAIKEVAGIIDGTVEVGSQFNVTDADGSEHTYEVLADYGDGTAAISIDGNVVENPYSLADLQQMKDLEDQKRLEAAKAEREQMENERAAQQTEETQPSFDFNQILNDNGNVVLVDVLDKDGNTKYPDSKLFLIRDTGANAKVVELKSDGTIVPHAVNKEDVATISSMSLDEYKQAMPESSMIEDNSGEESGEDSQLANLGLPKGSEIWMSGDGFGRPKENTLSRVVGIDVTDTTPLTAEEYVASNLGAHSLNYEGTETSKGVKQETGLSREDFAKTQLLAADGKGTTIDNLVHSLWENRPSNLESLDTQDIRNALIGILNSGFKASEARNFVENIRIAQAENILEEQKRAQENAAYAEQQKAESEAELKAKSDEKAESKAKSEEKLDNESSNESNDLDNDSDNDSDNEKINDNINDNINVPEDATDENPLGAQRDESDLPFSAKENGKQQTTAERAADVENNKMDDMKVVDNIVGQKTRKAFERLAKMMGADIQWQYSDKLGNGWIQETTDADGNVHRTIFITLDSSITEGAQFIFGHEMTHQIKNLNPAAYNELTQLVLDTYGTDAFDKAVDETMKRYSDAGFSGRARDYYAEEVVADAVGEMIRDLNLAHTLAMKMSHPLLAAIHEILQKIKLAFYGTEYSDVTKNIIRSIEQAYVKTANGEITNSETGEDVSFSLRQKPEPKKKGIGYKVFVLKDGKLYPPMVANPDGAATPVGVWLDADAAPIAGESKTGRPQVKQGGKGTQGGSGKLAYRPGWHLGVVPYAIQFNRKDAEGNKTLFPKNFVFAEVEYAADVDYQEEARQEGINPSGKYQHSLAGLKHLPTDGYYMYRTNPNPETDPWVITGAMKVNRILTRAEQAELVKNAGREPQQIQEGDIVTDDVVNSINQEIAAAPKFSLKVYHGSGADFTEFDFDYMGEGAGSQVFGWGGYVTSSKKIGKSYATLMDNDPSKAYYRIQRSNGTRFAKKYPTLESFLHGDKQIAMNDKFTEQEKIDYYNEMKKLAEPYHNLYEVDIPEDNGSNYLDFENPMSEEQINTIREALIKNGVDVPSWEKRGFKLDLPFKDVYAAVLPMMMRSTPKEVSKFLSSLGYTGIKYPAGTIHGGAEEGDTNYVIFKPEDMRITEHTKFSLKDNQGNSLNQDGTLRLDKIKSVDELTDEDFTSAFRNVELPTIPKNVDAAIGANGKPVVIKKNIFEKNWNAHKFTPAESKKVLNDALYNTDLVGHTQPTKKPNHWVAIKLDDKSPITVLEVNDNKDNVEVVGWYTLDERNLGRIKRQAERNGGELIMLTPKDDKVESLSTPPLSSAAKIDNSSETAKENGEKVDVEEPKTFEEFLNHPSLKFSIKNEEQRKAAEDAYEYASKFRPNKYAQYALVDMSNPSNSPQYYEKKVLADRWRRFYNKAVHNELDDVYKDAWGNYKLFDLDRPFADQVNEVKGDVPSEFNAPDVVANKNADNESGAEYHEYKQDEQSSVTYKDRYKAFKQREANREKTAGLRKERKEVEDVYKSKSEERVEYNKQLMKEYMDEHGLSSENDIPYDVWDDLRSKSFEKYQDELDSLFNKYKDLDRQIKAVAEPRFSLKDEKTLAGVHNISEEKLLKAIKQGGLANPSVAVIDSSKQDHKAYGGISLILPSDKIAKRTGKNAGTWQGDAYTPTYPQVERHISDKGSEQVNKDVLSVPKEIQHEVRNGIYRWLDGDANSGLKYLFLHEKGNAPKMVELQHKYSDKVYNELKFITAGDFNISSIGKADTEKVLSMYIDSVFDGDRTVYEEKQKYRIARYKKQVAEGEKNPFLLARAKSALEQYDKYGFYFDKVQEFVRKVERDHRMTGVNTDATLNEVEDYIKTNNLTNEFNTWLEGKEKEYGIKEVIFDGFTPSGNRRYVPNTLENVSKIMKKQGRNGATGAAVSFQNFAARLMPSYGTLKDIRSKKDLLTSDREKFDNFREKWSKVFFELGMKCQPDATGTFDDYGLARLSEAAMTSDPQAYLKKEYNVDFSDEDTKRLKEMVKAIKEEHPAMYFETKFERPVRFDEFSAAVVPTTTKKEVKDALKNAGVSIFEYDEKSDADRSRAFNEAINSSDNIRFSLAGERGAAAADKAEERTIRMDNLSVAKDMEKNKKKAKAIKAATGWERGADGKWRYEMPDVILRDPKEWVNKKTLTLSDIVEKPNDLFKEYPELFDAYPELKDMKILKGRAKSGGAFYNNAITLNLGDIREAIKYDLDTHYKLANNSLKKTLVHEIQHYIQEQEGFAQGGNSEMIIDKNALDTIAKLRAEKDAVAKEFYAMSPEEQQRRKYEINNRYNDLTKQIERLEKSSRIGYDGYNRLSGEVEARNVSARLNMTPEERRKSLAESTEDVARKDQILLGVGDVSFSLRDMADGKESGAADMAEDLKSLNTPDEVDDAIKTAIEDMPSGWKMANKKMIHVAQALGENRKAEIAGEEPKFSLKDGSLIKAGTYFSGGGLVEEGLKGIIDPVIAVEYDEKISGVYRNNFGQHIVTADVRDVDPKELVKQIDGEVEYFHASPVCKNYSQAKSNHAEVELDKETAASTAEFINAVKPKVVTIENVKGYKDSDAMKTITDALDANGYTWDADVYNAADYGGYTNRERLIVRAVRDGKLPDKPKKMAHKSGWYEAVADIIPTLTEKKNGVAPWMDIRLKADGIDWRNIDKPLYVMGSAYADGKVPHAFADELLPTLRTKSGDVIVMPDGKVYRALGRVLARVSGVSDDYKMPFSENLSHTIIGNGIPTQLTEHVIAPLLTGSDPKFSIRTYYGTGASFDKFDFSHMGEGEGSQAFGWGGYVTNSKDIAEDYTRRAKIRKDNGGFKFVTDMSANNKDMVRQYIYKHKDVDKGLDAMRKDLSSALEMFPDDDDLKELSNILAKKNEEIAVPDDIAYLYDVDIPDDNGDYLDWENKLKKSHLNKVNKELVRIGKEPIETIYPSRVDGKVRGQDLYDELSSMLGSKEAASKLLSDAGFVGIKYPAGTIYGGAKKGDTNYVIFDEANANIVGNTRFSLRYDQFEHDLNQWKKDNNLPKDAQRPTIPQRNAGESAVDFLRRVDEYRKQMALWKTAPTYEQHLLSDDTALGEFNRELQRGSVLKRIAFQDSMLAIRKAQEAIMKDVGVDRLNMAEDAYTAENRSHGKGKNEFEEYNNEFLQPLRKAYHQMKKVLGDSYDNVRIYMMAKHGLERDAQIAFKKSLEADYEDVAQRSAAYRAYKGDMNHIINDSDLEFGRVDFPTWRQRDNALRTKYSKSYMDYRYDKNGIAYDYSGLSAIFEGSDFEEAAHKLVSDIESKHVAEVQDLWNATNAATKKILRDGYKAGMMSKDTYQYVRDMYSHYIPLRGWDGTTADQVWDYIGGGKGAFNQTLKTAHGRTSIADDPIAYIENMAESGILLNNKNWVKQHLMLLAQNHPTSLLTLSKAWYVKSVDDNGNEEWIPATPQITSQMNSNQVKAAIDAFEKKMEQMAQTGDATQQRDGLNIAYPQTHSEEREHEVRVMKDGEEYVIYVNGDPQLAQAMNNTRAHRVREIQSGKLDRAAAWLGRKMAAAYTSLSPLFIPSNYFRDLTMTLASTAIREDAKYNYLLRKNLATSWNLGFMLRDYQNGKLREKVSNGNATPKEQMFYDFMMNGGETGFVSSLDVEDLKKKFKNDLKDLDRWKANPVKVGHTIMDGIEFLNRAIEDSNRFAVYMTSIQYGRSIDEAVNDAKDVTLNFNRKGTGEYGWQMVRNLYLFINPAVQSLQTLGALAKHHPFKFTAVTASWLASGVLVPIVNAALMSLLGGDDDKDKYWQFTKWDRRNNLIMWVPFTHEYVKIPLAQEFRAFYGIGDMIASKMMGGELAEESWSQYGEDFLGQVVDMLPLDPTGYDGNIAVSLMPNAIRPVFELAFNVDFTGKPLFKETEYNKYDPNFTKAYVGTPDWLVRASKMVNSIGNDYPDVQQNSIDAFGDPRYNLNNPAVVDHVLSSYLGGAYTMGSQVLGVLTKALNDPKEIKVADIPLFSKFVSNPDDRPVTKKQGDEFWDMKENHDRAANTLSKLKKQAKVDGDYSMLERFYGSEEYKQYKQDDVKVKKYEEDKKKERAEESGEEYRPHKLNAEDIYKAHATPKDDFEDLKLKQLYTKLNGFKSAYDLLVDTAPSQSDGYYNTNKAAIDAIDEISLDKQEISELKKGFLDDGKDAYNAEDMKQIRELRKKILAVLEKANKVVVANQKAKAKK